MPLRRRQVRDGGGKETASASNRQSRGRPNPMDVIPRIEKLKADRNRERSLIIEKHEAYIDDKMEDYQKHYAAEFDMRCAKAKELLGRYADAIQERQNIEDTIEKTVANFRDKVLDFATILAAAYNGRRDQAQDCIGSFVDIVPPAPANDGDGMTPNSDDRTGAKATGKGIEQLGDGKPKSSSDEDAEARQQEWKADIFSRLSW